MTLTKKGNGFKVRVEIPKNENGYWTAEIWDASEYYLPDFTPDWLYNLLEGIEKLSGGECDEMMESIFEIDDKFKNAIKNHPRCVEYKEEDLVTEKKFRIQKEKNSEQNGTLEAWVFDASEEPVPDFTPNWLCKILEEIKKSSGGFYSESAESLFEMDETYYNALKNHPSCQSYEEVNTAEY